MSSDRFVKVEPEKGPFLEQKLGGVANPGLRSSFTVLSRSGKVPTDAPKSTAVAEVRKNCGQNKEEVMCRGTKMIQNRYANMDPNNFYRMVFCGSMEVIFVRDNKDSIEKDSDLKYELVRLSLRDRRVMAQIELPAELALQLTTLACPIDNSAFLLMGFKGGRVEVRDSLTLKRNCFEFQFAESAAIEDINFQVDKFANLSVLHANGVISNLILERDEEAACFKRYIHNEDGETAAGKAKSIALRYKYGLSCLKALKAGTISPAWGEEQIRQKGHTEASRKAFENRVADLDAYKQKILFKPQLICGTGGIFIAVQTATTEIDLIDVEMACSHGNFRKTTIQITEQPADKVKRGLSLIYMHGRKLVIAYPVIAAKKNIINRRWQSCKVQVYGGFRFAQLMQEKTFLNSLSDPDNKMYDHCFAVVRGDKDKMFIAIGMSEDLKLVGLDDLDDPEMHKTIVKGVNTELRNISTSPCRRILVVGQRFAFSVWDVTKLQRCFTVECNSSMAHFLTSDFLFIEHFRIILDAKTAIKKRKTDPSFVDQTKTTWIVINFCQHENLLINDGSFINKFPLLSLKSDQYQMINSQQFATKTSFGENYNRKLGLDLSTHIPNDFGCDSSDHWQIIGNKVIFGKFDKDLSQWAWSRVSLENPKLIQTIHVPEGENGMMEYIVRQDSTVMVIFGNDMNPAKVYELDFDQLEKQSALSLNTSTMELEGDLAVAKPSKIIVYNFEDNFREYQLLNQLVTQDCSAFFTVFKEKGSSFETTIYVDLKTNEQIEIPKFHPIVISPNGKMTLIETEDYVQAYEHSSGRIFGELMPHGKIAAHEDCELPWFNCGFTPDSKFIFFKTKTGHEFYRSHDGTKVCALRLSLQMMISTQGDCHILEGIVDPISRKYYKWSLQNLVHLCHKSLNLVPNDIEGEPESAEDEPCLILGTPLPALFPYMLQTLHTCPIRERVMLGRMLNNYTVLPQWEGVLHECTATLFHRVVRDLLLGNGTDKYIACKETPLALAKSLTLNLVLEYLTEEEFLATRRHLLNAVKQKGFLLVLGLPEQQVLDFLKTTEYKQPFEMKTETANSNEPGVILKEQPFTTHHIPDFNVSYLQMPSFMKDLFGQLTKPRAPNTRAIDKTIWINYGQVKFPLGCGSNESIQLHHKLACLGESEVFTSWTIQRFIDYKWNQVQWMSYVLFGIYATYIGCITFEHRWWCLGLWTCQQTSYEVFQMRTIGMTEYLGSGWNFLDLMRICLQMVCIVVQLLDPDNENKKLQQQTFAYLTLASWISFLSYLRYFAQTRILIQYISASIGSMVSFMLVIGIMLVGFSMSYIFLAGKELTIHEFALGFHHQYLVLFGDFGELPINTVFEWTLFVTASLFIPLVMLNLLVAIISEAHAGVVENQNKNDYAQLNSIVLELERLLIWKRNSGAERDFMIIAEYENGSQNSWEGRTAATANKVNETIQKTRKDITNQIQGLQAQHEGLKMDVSTMKKDLMEDIQQKQGEVLKQIKALAIAAAQPAAQNQEVADVQEESKVEEKEVIVEKKEENAMKTGRFGRAFATLTATTKSANESAEEQRR